jgi:hypothetical protein
MTHYDYTNPSLILRKPKSNNSFMHNFEIHSSKALSNKLKSIHLSVLSKPLKMSSSKKKKISLLSSIEIPELPNYDDLQVSYCKPHFLYYHYLQDGEKDDGWGCAYRSLQTLYSWFIMNGYSNRKIPSILDIQKRLVAMGDKEKKFLNSREWIGAFEVSFVIQKELGFACGIQHISSGSQVSSLLPVFEQHFRTVGTPIMIGGGVLAYTLLGNWIQ